MKKFFSCLICSCIVVTLTLLTVREFPLPKIISMLLSFGEIVVIFFMSPVENVNRPVNEEESLVFLCRIRKILIGIFLLTVLFYFIDFINYLSIVVYTLGVIIVSMALGNLKNKISVY